MLTRINLFVQFSMPYNWNPDIFSSGYEDQVGSTTNSSFFAFFMLILSYGQQIKVEC